MLSISITLASYLICQCCHLFVEQSMNWSILHLTQTVFELISIFFTQFIKTQQKIMFTTRKYDDEDDDNNNI